MPSSSIQTQFPELSVHHSRYPAIDPKTTLRGAAKGKIVFMSGASRGIGRATAIAFAEAGAQTVYLTGRSQDTLDETLKQVRMANPGVECAFRVCDVTDEVQVQSAVKDCVNRFGGIDVVDSNAGYLGEWRKIGESDTKSWWTTWEVNLKGTYYVARYTIPHLIDSAARHAGRSSTGGHLILISSVGAQGLRPGASDYQTSKHAINRLCEFINVDHGEDGVKCFAIHPGGVLTDLGKQMPEALHSLLVDVPELGAGFAVWLCSGQADWARGRYLSSNWDVDELLRMKDRILADDLMVNRLRTSA